MSNEFSGILLSPISLAELEVTIEKIVAKAFQSIPHIIKEPAEILEEYLTRKQAASFLGVCLATLNEWDKDGTVPAYRIGSSTRVRYKRSDLEASFKKKKTTNLN